MPISYLLRKEKAGLIGFGMEERKETKALD
jgi:hypothetical protein